MRISTNTLFEMGSGKLGTLQAAMLKTQQQISTNLRIQSPSDDPVAAASALGVNQAISVNSQFSINRQNATSALNQQESILASVTSLLQSTKDIVVAAGNSTINDEDRQTYVTQLKSKFDELMGLANTRDARGDYIFGGYQTASKPFTVSATGASYAGDQGQRMLQVGPTRQLAVSDSGSAVFESGKTGNGVFATAANAANTGSGVISPGAVSDTSQLNGHSYTLTFSVDAVTGATTYLVNESPAAVPPVSPAAQTYTSGQAITVNGQQFDISGVPADGDSFTIEPSKSQSVFTTLQDLINTLSVPGAGNPGQSRQANGLSAASSNIDNALASVSAVRTTIGSKLNEIDSLESTGSDLKIQYTKTLSDLQDIDPIEAYSLFTQQQLTLTAAQKSFITISGLSLFNMLK